MTPEAMEWLALHRVHEGGVARLGGIYFNHGRPVSGALAAEFGRLIDSGLLALARPDLRGREQVCVTHTGQIRYTSLHNGHTQQQGSDAP